MAQFEAIRSGAGGLSQAQLDQGLRAHMNKVYGLMSLGMLLTALAAWAIAGLATTDVPASAAAELPNGTMLTQFGTVIYGNMIVSLIIMFAPLAFVLFGWGRLMERGSVAAVQLGFLTFAALIGFSLSSIFIVYTAFSIVQTFLVTAIAFAGLSLWGYTTKRDISGWGAFLMMGVFGLLGLMLLGFVLAMFGVDVSLMFYAISAVGLVIFAGLTAYYTQSIKSEYVAHAAHGDQEWLEKAGINGAFALYLAFLNMFQFLLMFMGQEQ